MGFIQLLPTECVVYALSFLGMLDDLIGTAATCSDAHALIRDHWGQLKPKQDEVRRRFIAQLASVKPPRVRPGVIGTALLQEEQLPQRIQGAATQTTTHQLFANREFRLGFTPGWVVTSMKLISPGPLLPSIVWCGTKQVILSWTEYGFRSNENELFVDSDGSLELMQFLKHFINPYGARLSTTTTCSVDTQLVITECQHVPITIADGYSWRFTETHAFQENDLSASLHRRFMLHQFRHVADYLAVSFHSESGEWLPVRVKQFTVTMNGANIGSIAGWACRQVTKYNRRTYYRIPMDQFDFDMWDRVDLVVDMHPSTQEKTVDTNMNMRVTALTHNIMRYCGYAMGPAFN